MQKKDLIRRFHAALASRGAMNYKKEILAAYQVESTKDLTEAQLIQILDRLHAEMPVDNHDEQWKKLASSILDIASRTGIKEPGDWDRFNGFMLNRSIYKKDLSKHTLPELKNLMRQFRNIENNNKKTANNKLSPRSKEILNSNHWSVV